MSKWFEDTDKQQGAVVSSRIRLARNLKGYVFPGKLSKDDRVALISAMKDQLSDLGMEYHDLKKMNTQEKLSLVEHCVFNEALVTEDAPMGLYLSKDQSTSILLCGDDHIRIQSLMSGPALRRAWETMDKLDDQINEKYEFAYDEKYGYLTSFPTNVGTGLRASVILHLPITCRTASFRKLLEEISRIGVCMKGVYGSGSDNYGSLYRISNQKTLGQTEADIIENVERISRQLAAQERRSQMDLVRNRRMETEDEVYKSYGVLKYARSLTVKEAMIYLSQLRMGINCGLIRLAAPFSVYSLMLGIQPGTLMYEAGEELSETETAVKRAEYIRNNLPELAESV